MLIADINNDQHPDVFSLDMMPYDHEIFLKSGGEDSDKVSQIKKKFGFEQLMQGERDKGEEQQFAPITPIRYPLLTVGFKPPFCPPCPPHERFSGPIVQNPW